MKLKGAQKSEIWRQQIVQLLKDSLVQLYLQPDGSEATHFVIYDFIRTFSADPRRNQFKITLNNSFKSNSYLRKKHENMVQIFCKLDEVNFLLLKPTDVSVFACIGL